ncbi:hypothetical protein [Methanimicrococcus hongohii]|uniref:hypothetical protein n=1 Tax=Methanimicrococcus hongohii TaxID=3028295 RepID=UPI00292F2450|nr:hypothetical protein [Methanimicrococcus sp. Hf6]
MLKILKAAFELLLPAILFQFLLSADLSLHCRPGFCPTAAAACCRAQSAQIFK